MTAYLASWEAPQALLEGKTQAVVVHKVPCAERDHPWGRVGVQEVVGPPSVDHLRVKTEVTHIDKVKCDKSKHTGMLYTHTQGDVLPLCVPVHPVQSCFL